MKKAILIHGYYAKEKYYNPDTPLINLKDYAPWLLKQLTLHDFLANAPLMPRPYFPVYEDWKREFERYDLNENTVLIGQSYGGGFLIRWLSEFRGKVGKVLLVAPAYFPFENNHPGRNDEKFFDFKLDKNMAQKTAGLTIFESTNDSENIKQSYQILQQELKNVKFIELENRGHFTTSTAGQVNETFPELLQEILR
jgi:predicted alpha/beta hydrolase family esterase